jgi:hypothetical protein
MRCVPRLGAVNAALISLYFAPVWGIEAVRALTSPYCGVEHHGQALAASYFRTLFDLSQDGMLQASTMLAGIKLVVSAAFVAYLIDFARALVVGREPDRDTLDAVLVLAGAAIMLWGWPALRSGEADLIRVQATQFLLLTSAMIVILLERQMAEGAAVARPALPSREPSLLTAALTAPTG